MGCFNLRSLLLAVFVISNCITWTASRHHFTHNASGHRSRHRRQGAGLYLPASFVVPRGAGAGAWGEWGEVSPCSRTCGGGVASQKRICLEVAPDGRPMCTGGDTKYFSCQTQDCPAGSRDFRAEQCAAYNDVPFKGVKHSWIPYTNGPKPCELNCMPKGERFYYRHKSKVIDGTRCNDESFDVCVDGTCQPVGCDMMLGSNAREDKCRECRGNGTHCYTSKGRIDSTDLRQGYNDVLLIPEGATSITIEEIKDSNNYLALRAKKDNVYYLNGDYHIDFPRTLIIAGAPWHYERSQQGFAAPDKLRCMGPTTEPLYLSLLLQDENVGIDYEYSIPTALAPPPNQQYAWVHGDFTPCSATCGGGFQTRTVTCRSRQELDVVDDSLCDAGLRPPANETCNLQACAATWVEGPWSACSKPCGQGGTRSRQIYCQKIISNGVTFSYPSIVEDQQCFELLGPKPELFQKCNTNASCPTWFTGPWKPCDQLCGEGRQTRQVVCHQRTNGRVEVLAEEECADDRPAAEQSCMLRPCHGVDWVVSEWSRCDTCLSKPVKSRVVECSTNDSVLVDPKFCANHRKPKLEQSCKDDDLPPCQVQWYATQWSNCSVECGKGVKTRRVFCGQFDAVSIRVVDDSKCDNETRYNDTTPCEIPKEKCPAKWFAGPWTNCTKSCGGGERSRKIMCFNGGKESLACAETDIPESMQNCNTGPCNADEMIPVDAMSTPVMDDDDHEDCVDEDEEEDEGDEMGAEVATGDLGKGLMSSDAPYTTLTEGSGHIDSELTTETGSGTGSTHEGSGEYIDKTTEPGDAEKTGSTVTEKTGSTATEETGSTVTKKTGSTVTERTGSTAPEGTGSTVTKETGSTATGEIGSMVTEKTGSTVTEKTGSTVTDKTGSTATEDTGSTVTEKTGSKVTDKTGSTATEETGSTVTEKTGSTVTEKTGSTATEETGSTVTEKIGSTVTEKTGSTLIEKTGSTATEKTGSTVTEKTGSTATGEIESMVTEKTGSTVTEKTGSTVTEKTGSMVTGKTGSTVTEKTGSTATEETGSTATEGTESTVTEETESTATEETGSTVTEKTGSTVTEKTGSTATEETASTVTEKTGSTVTEKTGSTATEETGSTVTEKTGSTVTEKTGSTVTEKTGSTATEETGSMVTEKTGSTATEETGSTVTEKTGSTVTEKTGSTATEETGSTVTEKTGSTVTEKTGSTAPEGTGSTVTEKTGSTAPEGTGSTVTKKTGSTATGETGSTVTEKTGSTVTEKTGSTATEETGSTVTEKTGSTVTEKTGSTATEETGSTITEKTGSTVTEKTGSTVTEKTGSTATEETGSMVTEKTGSTATEETGSTVTEKTGSTVTEKTGSTAPEGTGSTVTEKTGSTAPEGTGSTVTKKTGSTATGETGSTVTEKTGSTATEETGSTVTEKTGSTVTEKTGSTATEKTGSTVTEKTGSTVTERTGSTAPEGTGSTVTKETGSTATGEIGSKVTDKTGSTVTEKTGSTVTEKTGSTATEETGSTVTEKTGSTVTEKTGSTAPEGTGSTVTKKTGSTATGETGSTVTEKTGSTVTEKTGSTVTEKTGSTVTERTGSTVIEKTGSTVTEKTGSTVTEKTGSTEISSTATEKTGSTRISPSTTDSSTTEIVKITETSTKSSTNTSDLSTTESSDLSTTEGVTLSESSTESTEATDSTEITGSTDSTVTDETTENEPTGSTEITETESTETEVTSSTDTESTESGGTDLTESTTEDGSTTEFTEETSESSDTTPWDWSSTVAIYTKKPRCRARKYRCDSVFGCCPDGKTPARGPFDTECPEPIKICNKTSHGCCPDGVSPAHGSHNKGCPSSKCNETLYGCCKSDNSTPAEGNDQEGCPPPPPPCKSSKYGCCKDGKTEATGPLKAGCPETATEAPNATEAEGCDASEFGCCQDNETQASGPDGQGCPCNATEFSCCHDNETQASGPDGQGCPFNATEFGCCHDGVTPAGSAESEGCEKSSAYGCCPDGKTPAHGPGNEGCCLLYPYGCCPDNYKPAKGPHLEGCGCQNARFGCCPDNVTIARGYNKEGCGCEHTQHGCCPDKHTEASGPNYEGCSCHTYQFGCCPDGTTTAKGPNLQGCHCRQSTHGCCGDGQTAATGPEQAGCDCASSKYGCCPDGQTEAKGPKFSGCTDVPENKQAVCSLPEVRGPCHNYSAHWFFDTQYGGCSRFWYGGCEGNGNRFATKDECEDVCVRPSDKEVCRLPKSKGACTDAYQRWYYDPEYEQCGQFQYGGCLGNANKFETREKCQKQCQPDRNGDPCKQPIERGSCAGNYARWGFNAEAGGCKQFAWGGCEGNANRFSSEAACMLRCRPPGALQPECTLPQEAGNCTDKQPAWSFSETENRCVPFYYSGCGGNGNRFSDERSCEKSCPSAFEQETCSLPAVAGDCANYTINWYFNTENQRCQQFYYGGCGGNGNNFKSEEQCRASCTGAPATTTQRPVEPEPFKEEYCFLPKYPGPCSGNETRWAYSTELGDCEPFTYGGCEANRNNFPSKEYCSYYCKPTQDLCQLPMRTGGCSESLPRWFYDASTDRCSQFAYSGCDGNDNNFESAEHCERRCRASPAPTSVPTLTTTTVIPLQLPAQCAVSGLERCAGGRVWLRSPASGACEPHDPAEREGPCNATGVFPSPEACERACGTFMNLDVCRYGVDAGPCRAAFPKFYFDQGSGSCQQFTYGGCYGSPNRFSTIDECESVCMPETDPCKQPAERGNCLEYHAAWYYDEARDDCNQFYWTGCGGNSNRFATLDDCLGTCQRRPREVTTTSTARPAPTALTPAVSDECRTPESLAPCGVEQQAYYYNSESGACVAAMIGACRYSNSYRTSEECERQCGAFRGQDVCRAPLDPGPCRAAIPKFYWDLAEGRCREFTYGGCAGGPNRFSTIDECESVCRPETDPCKQPAERGNCLENHAAWYYDEARDDCNQFYWTGCGGNSNRFASLDECLGTCQRRPRVVTTTSTARPAPTALTPAVSDECRTPESLAPCGVEQQAYYYNSESGACVAAMIGACRYSNSYRTSEECERQCGAFRGQDVCRAPLDPGPCRAAIPKFYWDLAEGRCREFTYGGCAGGPNRFSTIDECESVCRPETDVCRAPLDPGPCRAAIPKFYWDSAEGRCREFTYGGCFGSPNRFSTIDECESVCRPETDPCKQPAERGNCLENHAAWYYDEARDDCNQFYWTGCGGNSNRFATRDKCLGTCQRRPREVTTTSTTRPAPTALAPAVSDECRTPESLAPCGVEQQAYYYNSESGACVAAMIGACRYSNSYRTSEECERQCGAFRGQDVCRAPLDPGPCRAAIPKLYWDLAEGRCREFTYGGCYGGPNRFSTAEECDEVCGHLAIDAACRLAAAAGAACAGAGAAGRRRWHHHALLGECREFIYLGCGGNRNNFHTKQECERHCLPPPDDDRDNDIIPRADCRAAEAECAAQRCQHGQVVESGEDGCRRCRCAPAPQPDCARAQAECAALNCPRGINRTRDRDGCESCSCLPERTHPCNGIRCPEGQRCVATPYRDPITQESRYATECRLENKPGSCPADPSPSASCSAEEAQRLQQCRSDPDCRGAAKCCRAGCSQRCLEPDAPATEPTSPPYVPEAPHAPVASPETQLNVSAAEGGVATLRCLFHSNPPPKITWRRGQITIDGLTGRYRLTSDGALEIVSLYRDDAGVYICIAENELGTAQQEIRLEVNGPVTSAAGIAGESQVTVVGELGRPLSIRCLAYGYPQPSIAWYHGPRSDMVPYDSNVYEARDNVLLIRSLDVDTLGDYVCQVYNGVAKAVSLTVEVRAYGRGGEPASPYLLPSGGVVVVTPPPDPTLPTTQPIVEFPDVPIFTAPVRTEIRAEQTTLSAGAELNLPCEVDGHPEPDVYWSKDGVPLQSGDRVQATSARLTVSSVTVNDSGVYGCHASNGHSQHSSTVQINVEGLYIPPQCKDNPFFANCELIVRSKYCHHKYYSAFCCKSCVEAGYLNPHALTLQADQSWMNRKK